MDKYIHKLIDYFFRHQVSDELRSRMYNRMLSSSDAPEREKALSRLWNGLEEETCPAEQIEEAFGRWEQAVRHCSRPAANWTRIAASWLLPLLLLGTSACLYVASREGKKKDVPVEYIHHYAALGTRERVLLPDSSVVWLNAGSLLVYPSILSETRSVYLSGEGFFEVAADSLHPFVVTTHHLQLRALGTSFNVSAYPEHSRIRATLETGRLQVEIEGQNKIYRLTPGRQLVYNPQTKETELLDVNAADYSDWRMGGLFFNDVPLGDMLSKLERTYNVRFHLYASVYQDQCLRVHFNKDESLENVLKVIKILIPGIDYRIVGNDVYLE